MACRSTWSTATVWSSMNGATAFALASASNLRSAAAAGSAAARSRTRAAQRNMARLRGKQRSTTAKNEYHVLSTPCFQLKSAAERDGHVARRRDLKDRRRVRHLVERVKPPAGLGVDAGRNLPDVRQPRGHLAFAATPLP